MHSSQRPLLLSLIARRNYIHSCGLPEIATCKLARRPASGHKAKARVGCGGKIAQAINAKLPASADIWCAIQDSCSFDGITPEWRHAPTVLLFLDLKIDYVIIVFWRITFRLRLRKKKKKEGGVSKMRIQKARLLALSAMETEEWMD